MRVQYLGALSILLSAHLRASGLPARMPTEMCIPGVGGDRKREAVGQRLGQAEPAPGKSPDGGFV